MHGVNVIHFTIGTKKVAASPPERDKRQLWISFCLPSFDGRSVEPATSENLRKLHGMLRWLAADRSAWTSDPAGEAVSVQRRTSMLDLQRAPAASMPRIQLRMADRYKSGP